VTTEAQRRIGLSSPCVRKFHKSGNDCQGMHRARGPVWGSLLSPSGCRCLKGTRRLGLRGGKALSGLPGILFGGESGYCHPKILNAMIEQAHRVTLTSRAFRNDQLPRRIRPVHSGFHGSSSTLPVVALPSRSRWAAAASRNCRVRSILSFIFPSAIHRNRSPARPRSSSRVAV
jgi:hypothetical protein